MDYGTAAPQPYVVELLADGEVIAAQTVATSAAAVCRPRSAA